MSKHSALALGAVLLIAFSPCILAQTNPGRSNTTSACNPSSTGSHPNGCYGYFDGLSDHATPGGPAATNTDTVETVPAVANVSMVPFSSLLYPGYSGAVSTQIVCHLQPWFGNGSNGRASNHIDIGMDMSQPSVVDAQVQNAIDRGCKYITFDWYGSADFSNTVALAWQSNLDTRCSNNSGACPLQMALMEDAGTITDPGSSATTKFEADLNYAYNTYMVNHASYWKMNVAGCSNRPVELAFGWGPSDTLWQPLRSWIESSLASCNNEPLVVPDGMFGLTDAYVDGAFNWIGVENYNNSSPGTVTTPGVSGTVQFDTHFESNVSYSAADWYGAAATSSKPVKIGAAFAGFNDTNASWGFNSPHTQGRKMSRECGRVWLNSWKQLTASGHFSSSNQIPFVGIPTWNDYEEGTAIETGIDNCLNQSSFTASISGSAISWSFSFGSSSYAGVAGDVSTVHHYALWEYNPNNGSWTEISDHNNGIAASCSGTQNVSCSASLSNYVWSAGQHNLYIQAVGQPSIQNHTSPEVTFDAEPVASYSSTAISCPNTAAGTTSTCPSVTVTNSGNATFVIGPGGATVTAGNGPFNPSPNPYPGCSAAPGATCTLAVSFSPAACQSYTGTLTVYDNARNNPQTVSLGGQGVQSGGSCQSSTFSPTSHSFGNVSLGSQGSAQQFTFTNKTGSTLSPTFSVPAQFVIVSTSGCTNVANNSTCTVTVNFQPTAAGYTSGFLNAKDGTGTVVASASVSGTGLASSGNGTVIYSAVQNMSGWSYCTNCTDGNGGATASWTPNISSPSEPNALNSSQTEYSAAYSLGGSVGYSDAKFAITLSPQDSVNQFQYDLDVDLPSPGAPQAISFQMAQAVSNNYFPFQFQCDFKGTALWNVWNPATNGWVSTGVGCSASQFPANTWVHLSFRMNTSGSQLHYTSMAIGGNTYSLTGLPAFSPSTYSPDVINAKITAYGDSNQDPYTIYVDNMIIYNTAAPTPNGSLSPATLDLGTVNNSAATASRTFTLTNSGTAALSISSVSLNRSDFAISSNNCDGSLGPGASCNIGIFATPTAYGTETAVLTVSGNQSITGYVTVTNLNTTNVLYSNLQNNSSWTICTSSSCTGSNGGATGTFTPNVTSPGINGTNSGSFALGGTTGYSDVKYKLYLAAQDSVTELEMDTDVYISNPSLPQYLEFGVGQAVSNTYYPFKFFCDLKNGSIWKLWNASAGSWVATSAPCTASMFAANEWTHLSFLAQRTSANQLQYLSVTVGANTYSLNSAGYNPSTESPDDIEAIFYEGGDSHEDNYTVYMDNLTIGKQQIGSSGSSPYAGDFSSASSWQSSGGIAQLADGAIPESTGGAGADTINPYFANLGATGWLRDSQRIPAVLNYIKWYINHLNTGGDVWNTGTGGTIYDYSTSNGQTGGCYQVNGSCYADSTDAYAATFLSLLWAAWNTGDSATRQYITSQQTAINNIGRVITASVDSDGLSWQYAGTPPSGSSKLKYLMDNSEDWDGLNSLAQLFTALGNSNASTYQTAATNMQNGILTMWNSTYQTWDWARSGSGSSTDSASNDLTDYPYPEAMAQMYPVAHGVVSPTDSRAQAARTSFLNVWTNWYDMPWTTQYGDCPNNVNHPYEECFPQTIVAYSMYLYNDANVWRYVDNIQTDFVNVNPAYDGAAGVHASTWRTQENGWWMRLVNYLMQ